MIDLRLVKRQCRVDFDDDDELLTALAQAAEEEVCRFTGRRPSELLEMGPDGRYPAPIRTAILIRTAELYHNAEGSDRPNATFEALIRPYQKL